MDLSIIVPVYKCEDTISQLNICLNNECKKLNLDYELIYVQDSIKDTSWSNLKNLAKKNKRIKGIRLSRNFGQHYAINAGIINSKGDNVIVMDCDLQEDPKYIKELIEKSNQGFDIVFTERSNRNFSFQKNILSKVFFTFFNLILADKTFQASSNNSTLSLISRKVADAYLKVGDYRRHHLMILRWLGFKSTSIKIDHKIRLNGNSSYTLNKMINHGIDGIVFNSNKILNFILIIGLLISIFSFILGIIILVSYFFSDFQDGWTSISLLILFSAGIIIFSIGIIGLYLGKVFDQVKGRPKFIIDEKINL